MYNGLGKGAITLKRTKIRVAAAVIAASSILQCIPVIGTAENSGEYMYISSAEEFIDLAKRCSLDSYSKGKTVILNGDIDFTGKDFSYLAYWDGFLDGSGYTISGVNFKAVDGQRGLIGIIGESGTVKNLNIAADITAKEEKNNAASIINKFKDGIPTSASEAVKKITGGDGVSSIGGVAGVNKGTIVNCTVSGNVYSSSETGGIVGVNEQSGRIEGCKNTAEIKGDLNTGGIAGKNNGIVKWSTNEGNVNPDPNEGAQNTGGICGRSYGAVEQCTNYGDIGYKNTGYNTGGITGCQNGYISECINEGDIRGRKDIGGITGQFEPYTNIDFAEDDIQKQIKDNLNELKDNIRKDADDVAARADSIRDKNKQFLNDIGLSGTNESSLGKVADSLSAMLDENGELAAALRDTTGRVGDQGDELVNIISEAQQSADKINDTATRLTDSLTDSNDEMMRLIDKTVEALDSGSADTNKLVNQLVSSLDKMENSDLLDQASETLKSIENFDPTIKVNVGSSSSLNRLLRDFNDNMSDIMDPIVKMSKDLSAIIDKIHDRNQKIEEIKKKLQDFISGLPTVKPMPTKLPIQTPAPTEKTKLKIGKLFDNPVYADDDDKDKSTLEKLLKTDIRDMDITIKRQVAGENKDAALVHYSINNGKVEGLSDTGGIAGCVAFDSITKPEENVNVSGDYSLNPSTAIKAVKSGCVNNGEITAKNNYSGGITGYSDIGAVKECISSGDVTVTDGGYAGGISGLHANNITHCISTSDIKASSDAGGIAGKGRNIDTSYALARIDSDGEKIGAIAGSASGNVKYNYFLKEKLSGLDGIDYNEKAEPVEKEILASDSGKLNAKMTGFWDSDWVCATGDLYMPQLRAFTDNNAEGIGDRLRAESADASMFKFKVKFTDNGETLKEFRVDYGYTLTDDDIPKLAKGENTYGDWDKNVKEPIIRKTTFNAQYNQSKLTLAYGGEPPKILVEGNFRPNTTLEVDETGGGIVVDDSDYNAAAVYKLTVNEDSTEYDGEITVRVRYKDANGKTQIGCVDNGAIVLTDFEKDGSYLKFKMDRPGSFVVLQKKGSLLVDIIIVVIVLLALGAVYVFIKKKKSEKKQSKDEINSETEPDFEPETAQETGDKDGTENDE